MVERVPLSHVHFADTFNCISSHVSNEQIITQAPSIDFPFEEYRASSLNGSDGREGSILGKRAAV
jgi:hypothetical protein